MKTEFIYNNISVDINLVKGDIDGLQTVDFVAGHYDVDGLTLHVTVDTEDADVEQQINNIVTSHLDTYVEQILGPLILIESGEIEHTYNVDQWDAIHTIDVDNESGFWLYFTLNGISTISENAEAIHKLTFSDTEALALNPLVNSSIGNVSESAVSWSMNGYVYLHGGLNTINFETMFNKFSENDAQLTTISFGIYRMVGG
jgi:hypothetical protein